jgi:ligand-binding sensor domain-containing protein
MRFIIFLPLVFIFISCDGQQPDLPKQPLDPYFIETTDTVSSLGPTTITRNILQDKNGIYWFATWQGIMRYDGRLFTNMTLKHDLIHFHMFSLLEDSRGDLWFGSIRGGVYKYDGRAYKLFTTHNGLPDNLIECMLEDNEGNIWFGTENGASRYNGKTFTNFTAKDGLSGNSIHSIAKDQSGKLWFATSNGVSSFDGSAFTSLKKDSMPFTNVRSVIADSKSNIWIGGSDGLFCYDGKTLTNISNDFTGYIFEDRDGNIWVNAAYSGVSKGVWSPGGGMALYRYKGTSMEMLVHKFVPGDNQVFGITQDKAGDIWFGTMNGVSRFNGTSFENFRNKQ